MEQRKIDPIVELYVKLRFGLGDTSFTQKKICHSLDISRQSFFDHDHDPSIGWHIKTAWLAEEIYKLHPSEFGYTMEELERYDPEIVKWLCRDMGAM